MARLGRQVQVRCNLLIFLLLERSTACKKQLAEDAWLGRCIDMLSALQLQILVAIITCSMFILLAEKRMTSARGMHFVKKTRDTVTFSTTLKDVPSWSPGVQPLCYSRTIDGNCALHAYDKGVLIELARMS